MCHDGFTHTSMYNPTLQYSIFNVSTHRCSAVSTTLHTTAYPLVTTACICNGTGIRLNRPIVRRRVRCGQHSSCKLMRTFDGSKGARHKVHDLIIDVRNMLRCSRIAKESSLMHHTESTSPDGRRPNSRLFPIFLYLRYQIMRRRSKTYT
ncbi:uncharacterized protein LAESUDRAFT_525222 [Laetiporus sulphureus 93-53]|uniref:Uncharacterized protein n=1 Tax=Laetiporus sulphureus 93-53 TaxID=1314785 RepID=A0A165BCV1_9APHY|nr:uncharacterized protein LAESUDRAFT_525222 [Laetiporus sulphureus 93-53]KZT00763.1 hypothetical protein LAESUDRAFT_525222 [Laetiporus sulphureus 93-53]